MKAKTKDPFGTQGESTTTGKVGAEIEAQEKNSDDGADTMSADELAAFEKIMGEIEGQEEDQTSSTPMDAEIEADDELAKRDGVIEVFDTGDNTGVDTPGSGNVEAPPPDDDSDEGLDEDQQKAFESIMAQIETNATDEPGQESVKSTSKDPKPEKVAEAQKETAVGPTIDETDSDTQDISDDIEGILKEIVPDDDEAPSLETVVDEPVSKQANVDVLEKTTVEDVVAVHKKEDNGPENEDSPQTIPPDGNNEKLAEPEKKPSTNASSGHQVADKHPTSTSLQPEKKAKGLRETTKSTGGRKKKIIMASAVAMLFLALAGYYYWPQNGIVDSKVPSPTTETLPPDEVAEKLPASQPRDPEIVVHLPSDKTRLKTAAENLDRLRNELIEKQAEIEDLRVYYQAGINAEIQGIVDMFRKTGEGTIPFKAAIADPRISLGLSAIQRRDTYIKKLVTPAKALFVNSEELLFFSRKAGLLDLMADKTSDIDIDGFIKQTEEIRDIHGSALMQLNIDAVPASPRALESIWRDIAKRLPTKPVKPDTAHIVKRTDDAVIWDNICNGDYTLKHKLTALSPEAAHCLAAWKGKDLFLNALTILTPETARQLATWEGDWLGLNGLTELSPEAAVYLSQWKGKGLSLNGLSRLSPRLVAILSEWQGNQIELVNVKHMAHWENPKTRLFLSEGLKRKGN